MQLLLLEFAIFVWKQVPYIGLAAEPVVSSPLLHTCSAAGSRAVQWSISRHAFQEVITPVCCPRLHSA